MMLSREYVNGASPGIAAVHGVLSSASSSRTLYANACVRVHAHSAPTLHTYAAPRYHKRVNRTRSQRMRDHAYQTATPRARTRDVAPVETRAVHIQAVVRPVRAPHANREGRRIGRRLRTSHHITSYRTTLHHITSHHTTPHHHITSHHITSQHSTAKHITSRRAGV